MSSPNIAPSSFLTRVSKLASSRSGTPTTDADKRDLPFGAYDEETALGKQQLFT